MSVFAVLAEAFGYPAPGRLEALQEEMNTLPPGPVRDRLETFTRGIGKLSLTQWEELFTRTLDLNPAAPPYVGYVIWGENYTRSHFMARLGEAMGAANVELEGELPDHLVPILRYLDCAPLPLPELESVLEPALQSIHAALAKVDPGNLYLGLLAAALEALQSQNGGMR